MPGPQRRRIPLTESGQSGHSVHDPGHHESVGVRVAEEKRSHHINPGEHNFSTEQCNLFHIRDVRVIVYMHSLDGQPQPVRFTPQPFPLGTTEPQGLHMLFKRGALTMSTD